MQRLACLVLGLCLGCSGPERTGQSTVTEEVHAHSSDFLQTENPISEGGRWQLGGTDGGHWTDVSTTSGRAIGHQVGADYTDATAILRGAWNANQMALATVFATSPIDDTCLAEVELRLRSSISLHSNRGYEVAFKVSKTSEAYMLIVRWNGAVGDFTVLLKARGAHYGVKHGDTIKATIIGDVITAYKNDIGMGQVRDSAFSTGNPGMGFNLKAYAPGCSGINDKYGFSNFSATDGFDP